ncbi:MAG TPA: hypothetical protein DCG73_04260 [Morganella sp. (in: Bacteria)]|nr:hypothetical protein [Morganella sp. (in: enterobacteria)]
MQQKETTASEKITIQISEKLFKIILLNRKIYIKMMKYIPETGKSGTIFTVNVIISRSFIIIC